MVDFGSFSLIPSPPPSCPHHLKSTPTAWHRPSRPLPSVEECGPYYHTTTTPATTTSPPPVPFPNGCGHLGSPGPNQQRPSTHRTSTTVAVTPARENPTQRRRLEHERGRIPQRRIPQTTRVEDRGQRLNQTTVGRAQPQKTRRRRIEPSDKASDGGSGEGGRQRGTHEVGGPVGELRNTSHDKRRGSFSTSIG